MKTLDRYIIRQFLFNYLILFAVTVGLIVMLDLILNFDEFVQAGQQTSKNLVVLNDGQQIEPQAIERNPDGAYTLTLPDQTLTYPQDQVSFVQQAKGSLGRFVEVARLIADFYWPMIFLFYVYIAGLLAVGAAAFTLAQLLRNRELVAMLAGGISLHQVALPLLVAGFISNMLLFVDQEVVIPRLADKLNRSQADIKRRGPRPFTLTFVPDGSGALFSAGRFDQSTGTLQNLTIVQRDAEGKIINRITAASATWDQSIRAWRLVNGQATARSLANAASQAITHPLDLFPSDLDPTTLVFHRFSKFRHLLSLEQITALMDKQQVVDVSELQVIRHSRFSLVVINMLILAMGLPFFLLRNPKNLLAQSIKAAPLCIGAWAAGFVMYQISPGSLIPPAAVAWMPVAMYLPAAYYLMDTLET